jgi:hypothetical protein
MAFLALRCRDAATRQRVEQNSLRFVFAPTPIRNQFEQVSLRQCRHSWSNAIAAALLIVVAVLAAYRL